MKVVLCCGCLSFGFMNAMDANTLVISSIQETQALHEMIGFMENENIGEETIEEAINSYLDNGFDINARYGELRETLLHIAVNKGLDDVAKFLVNKKINVNITSMYTETALHIAACKGNVELVRLLSERQTDVNLQNCEGETAIYNAAYQLWGNNVQQMKEVIQILLDNGADPLARKWVYSFPGQNAIDTVRVKKKIARQEGKDVSQYQEVIDLMLRYAHKA